MVPLGQKTIIEEWTQAQKKARKKETQRQMIKLTSTPQIGKYHYLQTNLPIQPQKRQHSDDIHAFPAKS